MDSENKTLEYYVRLPYRTHVMQDNCGDTPCFMAYNPELEGCMAQGNTPQEALASLQEARSEYIAEILELGWNVPEPIVQTSVVQIHSSVSVRQSNQPSNIIEEDRKLVTV